MTKNVREPLKNGITRVTSHRTGKVSYEARWSWLDAAGKRHYKTGTLPTLKKAQAARAKAMAAIAEDRYAPAARMTVNDYAQTWLERQSRKWSSGTRYIRMAQYRNHVQPRIGGLQIGRVDRAQCQAIGDDLANRYKPANVRSIMALVSALFGAAVRDGVIERNPAHRLELPAVRNEPHAVWTPVHIGKFLAVTESHQDFPLYMLLATTGMRIGEAIALRWANVDLDRSTATIAETLRRIDAGAMEPGAGTKTLHNRTIALTSDCVDALRVHQAAQTQRRRDARTWDIRGFVFDGRAGNHLSYSEASHRFRRAQVGLDLPPLTFHGFRHSVGTILMQQNVHPVASSAILGHSVRVNMSTYSHHSMADLQRASDTLGATLRAVTTTTTPVDSDSESDDVVEIV